MGNKKNYKTYVLIILGLILVSVLLFALITKESIQLQQDKNGNFILYINDQRNIGLTPAKVKVYIDEKLAINENLYVGNQKLIYSYNLEKGKHTIRVVTKRGDRVLEKEFEILDKQKFARLDYHKLEDNFGNSGKFDFKLEDSPN